MRRSSPLFVLCLVCATLVLAAPASADVVVTVTPDSDLSAGDVVTVEASGFPPNAQILVCEVIIELAPSPDSCGAPGFTVGADGSGSFANTYTVQRFVAAQLMAQVDCVVEACGIAVADNFDIEGTMVVAPISFLPGPVPRPDAILKRRDVTGELVGNDIYNNSGSGQTFSHSIVPGGKWSFAVRLQNDGEATDDLRVRFAGGFADVVRYFVDYYDVTALVNGPGFAFEDVPVGATRNMAVQFRAPDTAVSGNSANVRLRLTSNSRQSWTTSCKLGSGFPERIQTCRVGR